MKIVDISPETENLYFCCLEEWSDEMKEAGDHKKEWYSKMKDKGLCVKLAVENENVAGTGGVGVQSGQLVAEKQAKVVLTGNVGPNASQTLESAGIDVVVNVEGSVKEAIERFKNGELKSTKGPNAEKKAGLN